MSVACSASWEPPAAPRRWPRPRHARCSRGVPPNTLSRRAQLLLFGSPLITAFQKVSLLCSFIRSATGEQRRKEMDYRIRVQGHLDPSWQHHFEELRLEHEDAETILLSGALPDRGAQTA